MSQLWQEGPHRPSVPVCTKEEAVYGRPKARRTGWVGEIGDLLHEDWTFKAPHHRLEGEWEATPNGNARKVPRDYTAEVTSAPPDVYWRANEGSWRTESTSGLWEGLQVADIGRG